MPSSLTDENQRYNKCVDESLEMFVTDVLAYKSDNGAKCIRHFRKPVFAEHQITKPSTAGHLDTAELVELLKQSAGEHLTTFRQLEAQKFGSVCTIVTTDYEALYAYKCGQYQLLSKHNVARSLAILTLSRLLSRILS